MKNCTGIFCPMQYGKVDPATCQAAGSCSYATPPKTKADRIRAMTDEELDGFLNEVQGDAYLVGFHARAESRFTPYGKIWLEWLKQEANDAT